MAKKADQKIELPTTQRAYTLRLRGSDSEDHSWRDALWATHEAVNKGAKVFGDWLLTLRGGLSHNLADAIANKDGTTRAPRDEAERGNLRILLALSWLSVESKNGAPTNIVASGTDSRENRNKQVIAALNQILVSRGVQSADIPAWIIHCQASLSAAIREDAVWVNRSKCFDEICNSQDVLKARTDSQTLLWFLFSTDYLVLDKKQTSKPKETGEESNESEEAEREEKRGQTVQSGKGAGQRTRHPFSHIFGGKEDSKGFGKPKRILALKDFWHRSLKKMLEDNQYGCGIPLRDPKGTRVKDGPPSQTELHREMFSKASSRLAQIHTKQKQQEVEREQRQQADEELKSLEQNPTYAEALRLLENFGAERGAETGAQNGYRIRPRATVGWERIVEAWSSLGNGADLEDKRIEQAKQLQDEDRDKKFGDINLFIALTAEEYKPVWFHNGQADSSILKKYVKGKKARADAERLKVAAYRHPDPFFNPVFCQFGVSRPRIEFGRLKDFTSKPEGKDFRAVAMLLWNGQKADNAILIGASKRLDSEIGSACDAAKPGSSDWKTVAKRGRFGAAAVAAKRDEDVRVGHVFDMKSVDARTEEGGEGEEDANVKEAKWNGSLRADRGLLKRIGELRSGDATKEKAEKLRRRLKWWLTISLELQPQGPWYDFIKNAQDTSPFQRKVPKDEDKGKRRTKGTPYISFDLWPHEEFNKPLKEKENRNADEKPSLVQDAKNERLGRAKLILSRLPGLRVLSVDLGHRYAAACAVWETLTIQQMSSACAVAEHSPPSASDVFLHLVTTGMDGKKRTTIYRRIGPDVLPDEKPHPAPWARLDRQFLIKLQGEERPARAASGNEMQLVKDFAKRHGLISDEERDKVRAVDELMSRAVHITKLALKRHARRAKIAHAFDPGTQSIHGMGGKETAFKRGDEAHIKFLTDALFDWHSLASDSKWTDPSVRDLWNTHIAILKDGWKIEAPQANPQLVDEKTRPQRRKDDEALRERIKPLAQDLAHKVHPKIHQAWKERWEKDDGLGREKTDFEPAFDKVIGSKTTAKKQTSGFHAELRVLTNWIMGKQLPGATDHGWKQNVGGLSITRIATKKSLYQLHKAFAMRARPNKPRGAPEKGESNAGIAKSILDAMERMREQRVKQLASRIAEAALGIGRIHISAKGKDQKRPRERVNEPCHAVVIENLTNYRPDQLQTRRENRQLMDWSSSKVEKYLGEACQLHGLHLRKVLPNYTSRQDSRTGAPGMRCQDVTVWKFMQSLSWRKQVAQAEKKQAEGKGGARERLLYELNLRWKDKAEAEWKIASPLRVPMESGEIFVSANGDSPAAKGLQADLNAAANIGLKALLDPDWEGAWWYVPCEDSVPLQDTIKGCPLFRTDKLPSPPANVIVLPEADASSTTATKGKKRRGREKASDTETSVRKTNLWRDVGVDCFYDVQRQWLQYAQYRKCVENRVAELLAKTNGTHGQSNPSPHPLEEKHVPF